MVKSAVGNVLQDAFQKLLPTARAFSAIPFGVSILPVPAVVIPRSVRESAFAGRPKMALTVSLRTIICGYSQMSIAEVAGPGGCLSGRVGSW